MRGLFRIEGALANALALSVVVNSFFFSALTACMAAQYASVCQAGWAKQNVPGFGNVWIRCRTPPKSKPRSSNLPITFRQRAPDQAAQAAGVVVRGKMICN